MIKSKIDFRKSSFGYFYISFFLSVGKKFKKKPQLDSIMENHINKKNNFLLLALICLFIAIPEINAQKPNILLIVSDDLNTRIGPYMDIDKHTPHLDRLATEGVQFSRAYCQYPICGPSRASFMSGLYPETNGVLNCQGKKQELV